MQGDFFQVLRRVQKEERNKSSLARVENDFYKQLRDYIKDLERSVANDPFGNEQLLLNNAQRIATEICELRESKITQAANNNIYRSFLLFRKDNPQFDLLDTTPLNLTDEEETLYFSLMDALKNHRYRISLDEYTEESSIGDNYEDEEEYDEDFDEDEESSFVEDSYESSSSVEEENDVSEEMEDEISDALGESDEVLDRLNQIKNAKVITDETYENIDKQVANQMYPGQGTVENAQELEEVEETGDLEVKKEETPIIAQESRETEEPEEESTEVQTNVEEETKSESSVSTSPEDFYKNPDSQFVDLDKLEPNYDDDYYNSIAAGSSYAAPSEDDFNLIFAKPKKPKAESANAEEKAPDKVEAAETNDDASPKVQSTQSSLGFSSGLDVKEKKVSNTDGFNKAIDNTINDTIDGTIDGTKKDDAPQKPVDKTRGGLFARDEIENATVVLSEDVGEMVGIDGKVYGPFLANDVVILPNITAQILIDNNKASLVKY